VSLGSRRTTTVHEFYRYPARFSPDFARATIEAFTEPGDLVLDPFVGGGTTLVEARLLGRLGVGSDLNSLAVFVSEAKTQLHSSESIEALERWADRIDDRLRMDRPASWGKDWANAGYLRHLDAADTWRLRHMLALAIRSLPWAPESANLLARCAVLRTGQWALDMRQHLPTVPEFREKLLDAANAMTRVAGAYSEAVRAADREAPKTSLSRTTILNDPLPGLAAAQQLRKFPPPRLILTSPPYPGVYVNYHRWKVRGRLETAAPYWVAGCRDGHGIAHYTMGARVDKTQNTYFQRLEEAWDDVAQLADDGTWIVQIVGFNDAEDQLPRYLDAMSGVGLQEVLLPEVATADDGRLWRDVPSRRWWVRAGERAGTAPHTAREVVLIHRVRQ